ncbi:hypothetical protein ABK040_003516 [Willaertia magna]
MSDTNNNSEKTSIINNDNTGSQIITINNNNKVITIENENNVFSDSKKVVKLHSFLNKDEIKIIPTFTYQNNQWISLNNQNNIDNTLNTLQNVTNTTDNNNNTSTNNLTQQQPIKCLSFNVLFDIYQNDIAQHDLRQLMQLKMFELLQADILGLNEVTPIFLRKLMEEKWVQENYFLSEIEVGEKKESHSTILPYGNLLLLSKRRFSNVVFVKYKFSNPATFSRRSIFGFADLNLQINEGNEEKKKIRLCIGCIHLKALKECFDVRKKQVQELYELANHFVNNNKPSLNDNNNSNNGIYCNELIFAGDYNINMPFENLFITQYEEFNDLWLRKNSKEKGYTMDAIVNPMVVKLFPKDAGKQLRLDRVLQWKSEEALLECEELKLFATKPIKKLIKLFFTKDEDVNKFYNVKDYLFCSDHFGVYYTLKLKNN